MLARRVLSVVTTVLGIAASAASAGAQPYTLQYLAGSGVGEYGYEVGPYTATLTDLSPAPGTSSVITIVCADLLHGMISQPYDVFVTRLVGGNLANTRGGAGSLGVYKRVAWLSAQFAPSNHDDWAGLHAAIWKTTLPGSTTGLTEAAPFLSAVAAAEAGGYAGFDFDPYVIITDVTAAGTGFSHNAPGMQEFVSGNGGMVTTTPEPTTVALAAAGLIAVAGVARRRRTA